MRKRQTFRLTAVAGVIALILAGVILIASRSPEPEYQGRKLGLWLDDFAAQKPSRFNEAVREIGTNALPYVVDNLERNDSTLRRKYLELWAKSPKTIQQILPQPRPLLQEVHGANVFFYIGSNSLPSAIALLQHGSPTVRRAAAWGIGTLRRQSTAANRAIPALIAALGDSDKQVRFYALLAFKEMGADASNAVPAITKILSATGPATNSDTYVHAAAALALGKIGPAAEGALPALRIQLLATNSYLRGQSAVAIWRVGADAETSLPVLLREMPNESEHSKWDWIIAVGEMGPRAKEALPQLKRELVEDKQAWVLEYVTNALRQIDPENFQKNLEP